MGVCQHIYSLITGARRASARPPRRNVMKRRRRNEAAPPGKYTAVTDCKALHQGSGSPDWILSYFTLWFPRERLHAGVTCKSSIFLFFFFFSPSAIAAEVCKSAELRYFLEGCRLITAPSQSFRASGASIRGRLAGSANASSQLTSVH